MKIKIALVNNPNYLYKFPEKVRKALSDEPFPQCRIVKYDDPNNFIHLLDKLSTYIKNPWSPEIDKVEKGTLCKTDYYHNIDCMYFIAKGCESITIVEVDTDRPWFIGSPEESNYGESLIYMDYIVTESSLNYVRPLDLSGLVYNYKATSDKD